MDSTTRDDIDGRNNGKRENEIEFSRDDIGSRYLNNIIELKAIKKLDAILLKTLPSLYEEFKTPSTFLSLYNDHVAEIENFLEQENGNCENIKLNEDGQLVRVKEEEVLNESMILDDKIEDDIKLKEYFKNKDFNNKIREMLESDAGQEDQENFKLLAKRTVHYLKKAWDFSEEDIPNLIKE